MPLPTPSIDDRRYADLVRDTLARVPVHTPEWTQLAESDPGVTLVELFAFLTESLLYRANRVPELARAKFLRLLGVPLAAVAPAQGLVAFGGARPDQPVATLPPRTEVRAGALAFRTVGAIDVLPLEARAFVKFEVTPADADKAYYQLLYQSAEEPNAPTDFTTYETRELDGRTPVALAEQTVDGVLWLALLAPSAAARPAVAQAIEHKTLSLGLVPHVEQAPQVLGTAGQGRVGQAKRRRWWPTHCRAPTRWTPPPTSPWRATATWPRARRPTCWPARAWWSCTCPPRRPSRTWANLDPLEAGVGDFPPAIEDSALAGRVLTWVRVAPSTSAGASFLWAGVNAAMVEQRVAVGNELLATADGQPDQFYRLARGGVVPASLRIDVVESSGASAWAARGRPDGGRARSACGLGPCARAGRPGRQAHARCSRPTPKPARCASATACAAAARHAARASWRTTTSATARPATWPPAPSPAAPACRPASSPTTRCPPGAAPTPKTRPAAKSASRPSSATATASSPPTTSKRSRVARRVWTSRVWKCWPPGTLTWATASPVMHPAW